MESKEEKIKKAIEKEMDNLKGIVYAIVDNVLTDQSKLPKFKDVIGILKEK